MRGIIEQGRNKTEELTLDSLPWSPEEELLVVRPLQKESSGGSGISMARNVVLFAAMATMIYGLLRSSVAPGTAQKTHAEKLFV
jgi:hypothetical protein